MCIKVHSGVYFISQDNRCQEGLINFSHQFSNLFRKSIRDKKLLTLKIFHDKGQLSPVIFEKGVLFSVKYYYEYK